MSDIVKHEFAVVGMHCGGCVKSVTRAVSQVSGVRGSTSRWRRTRRPSSTTRPPSLPQRSSRRSRRRDSRPARADGFRSDAGSASPQLGGSARLTAPPTRRGRSRTLRSELETVVRRSRTRPSLKSVDPAVHRELLPAAPRVLHDGGLADVGDLLDHVELAQPIDARRHVVDRGDARVVLRLHVLDVAQPVVGEAHALVPQRRRDAAAAVVAADDDVPHLQHVHRELHHRKAIEIAVDDDIGDVAMDEELAGKKAHDLVGGHAAVGASDPQILGPLLAREPGEEFRIVAAQALRPGAVVVEEMRKRFHRRTPRRDCGGECAPFYGRLPSRPANGIIPPLGV